MKFFGQSYVLLAWLDISSGMVVHKNYRFCIVKKRFPKDPLWIDHHGIAATSGDLQLAEEKVIPVDEEGHKLLRRSRSILPSEMYCNIIDGLQIGLPFQGGVVEPPTEFQRCGNRSRVRVAHAFGFADFGGSELSKLSDGPCLTEEFFCYLNGAPTFGALSYEDRQQFSVTEFFRTILPESLPGAIRGRPVL